MASKGKAFYKKSLDIQVVPDQNKLSFVSLVIVSLAGMAEEYRYASIKIAFQPGTEKGF